MSDLKPCPFCGEKPIEYIQTGLVICSYFRCSVNPECKSKEDWNMRATVWISVDDQLPEENQRVFAWVYNPHLKHLGEWAESNAIHNGSFWCGVGCCNVTHWMPINPPNK